jgi:hypothetical protein
MRMDSEKRGVFPAWRGVLLVVVILVSSACYHSHLIAHGESLTSSMNAYPAVLNASRIVPPPPLSAAGPPAPQSCSLNGLYHVHVSATFGDALGTVFTFGEWSRVTVGWWCAKLPPQPISPLPSSSPPAVAPVSPNPTVAPIRTRVNSLFWGAVQQDLTPLVKKSKNPANCNSGSMRQVTVAKNYGYSLITVLTLGIWAPMGVEWQCGGDGSSKPSASARPGAAGAPAYVAAERGEP